jgi:chorismate dehydratase
VKTLALDEGSRTSATLTRVLLYHKYGVEPDVEPLPLDLSSPAAPSSRAASDATSRTPADAILLIGDRAMFPVAERFAAVWDLGEEWNDWTGLPFVFAAWAARRGDVPVGLAELLSTTRDAGVADAETIARREAVLLGLDPGVAVDYLTNNLHFTLGPAERSGLKLFSRLAAEAGLCPGEIDLVFRDRTDALPRDRGHDEPAPPPARQRHLVGAR